jgi:hypothetical protein
MKTSLDRATDKSDRLSTAANPSLCYGTNSGVLHLASAL